MKERTVVASLMLLCFLPAFDSRAKETELSWSGAGVILLKNGNVVVGKQIQPRDKVVTVRVDETAQVQIASDQIVHIASDMRTLYHYQVVHTTRWETGDHLYLSKWALRNGLIEEAYAHYLEVKHRSPDHAKFKQLEAELREALLKDPVFQAATRTAASYSTSNTVRQSSEVSHAVERTAVVNSSNSDTSPQPAPSITPIQQDYYRRQIQPFLVMRCGQAGCHGALGKSEFHAAKSGSLKGRPASEMSLESTIKFLQGNRPEETVLWQKATHRHGLQPTAGLDPEDATERELLQRLRTWHQSLSSSPTIAASRGPSGPTPLPFAMRSSALEPLSPITGNSQIKATTSTDSDPLAPEQVSTASLVPEVGVELIALEREIAKLEAIEKTRKPAPGRHDPEAFNRLQANPLRDQP